MPPSPVPDQSVSRRAVLAGLAGASAGAACTTTASATAQTSAQTSATATVLTRNVYLGVDLSRLFGVLSLDGLRTTVGDLLGDVDPDRVAARADAVAAEVEATDADVVALQEAAVLRTQRPGDFGSNSDDAAETVVVDVLAELESALAARGLDYEVAAAAVTTDMELPAQTEDGRPDVRLTDRDVLLVRDGTSVEATATGRFDSDITFPLPWVEGGLAIRRGYCRADLTLDGVAFTAVSTHLESIDSGIRTEQAAELLDALPADRPLIVAGDFNSGPGASTDAYDRLTGSLTDAYAERRPDAAGFTCCQASDLANAESGLNSRIDGLLYRGAVRPTAVDRVGHRPDDRIEYEQGGEPTRLWPSDHAGVYGTFEVGGSVGVGPATGTASQTPTDRSTPTAGPTGAGESTADGSPADATRATGAGLGVLAAVLGVAGGVAARARRE